MVHGIDIAMAIQGTLDRILKSLQASVPTVVCTDSRSLYDCMVKLGTTTEKRLMIDVMAVREAYERRELSEFRWIGTRQPSRCDDQGQAKQGLGKTG